MMDGVESGVLFHPDAVEGAQSQLVGRRAAGSAFLEAYIRYSPDSRVNIVTQSQDDRHAFQQLADQRGWERDWQFTLLDQGDDISQVGTLFLPDPSFGDLPWRRRQLNPRAFSLVGINHTISTRRVLDTLREMILAPVEQWDALICTSHAAQAVVRTQIESFATYFAQRFRAERMPLPQLPVIPLGVEPDRFFMQEARSGVRATHGVGADDLVLLAVGRFSSVEKAHPLPLLQVLGRLEGTIDQPVHLWMFGWAKRPAELELFLEAAREICPWVKVSVIDGTDPALRQRIWAGADVFTLPTDSLQETFGLVTIEAMAAGLPVVMPDWDGIRDTVRDGETGFLIPTRMARPGSGKHLAERFWRGDDSYLQYLSLAQQQIAIDQTAYARALSRLLKDPALRGRMGAAGRAHVARNFSWRRVIGQYHELAAELTQTRLRADVHSARGAPGYNLPQAIDPFRLFEAYPSHRLSAQSQLSTFIAPNAALLDQIDAFSGRQIFGRWIAPRELVEQTAQAIHENGPLPMDMLSHKMGIAEAQIEAVVLLLAKFGLIEIQDP